MRILPVLPLALLLAAAPAARAEPLPAGVAVVDMLKLITSHPGYGKAKAALEARKTQAEQDAKDAEERLKSKVKDYELLGNRDTPQAREMERGIEFMRTTAKFQYEWAGRVAQDEYARALVSIYQAVQALVANYARLNRLSLVFQMTKEELKAGTREEFLSNLIVRSVVFYENALDITDKVIATYPPEAPAPAPGSVRPPAPPAAPPAGAPAPAR